MAAPAAVPHQQGSTRHHEQARRSGPQKIVWRPKQPAPESAALSHNLLAASNVGANPFATTSAENAEIIPENPFLEPPGEPPVRGNSAPNSEGASARNPLRQLRSASAGNSAINVEEDMGATTIEDVERAETERRLAELKRQLSELDS